MGWEPQLDVPTASLPVGLHSQWVHSEHLVYSTKQRLIRLPVRLSTPQLELPIESGNCGSK